VFTLTRSMEEEPDSVPAASPRLPRSTSPWPPGHSLNTSQEFPATNNDRYVPLPAHILSLTYPPGSSRSEP
jgi:hypothetical protein